MSKTSATNQSLKVEVYSDGTEALVSFDGMLDENVSLGKIQLDDPKIISFDLSGLRLLNSSGIRSWLQWIRALEKRSPRPIVYFKKCTRPVIDQINAVSGFLPEGSVIVSFYVPYYCDACSHAESMLLESGKDYVRATAETPMNVKYPTDPKCAQCGAVMELDVMPARYFAFLQYRR